MTMRLSWLFVWVVALGLVSIQNIEALVELEGYALPFFAVFLVGSLVLWSLIELSILGFCWLFPKPKKLLNHQVSNGTYWKRNKKGRK